MGRLTEYHCGVAVIKNKEMLKEAMAKLAAYEDAEEENKHMNDGWIPIEERLPEKTAYYLVTIEDYGMPYIGIKWFASYDDYDIEESKWRELDDGEKVIAWRPLPEPYRPERSE